MYWNTVAPELISGLNLLMQVDEFRDFRLVGGTALSLHLGHRMSIDIDLFTDLPYDSVDFAAIDRTLRARFPYVNKIDGLVGFGRSYFIGESEENNIKLDVYYTEPFIDPIHNEDGIRMASIHEIAAMKVDVISRGGRKKDFWDIHELLDHLTIKEMIDLHEKRHPYTHNRNEIVKKFVDFSIADTEFDPICLRDKIWELIKYDFSQLNLKIKIL